MVACRFNWWGTNLMVGIEQLFSVLMLFMCSKQINNDNQVLRMSQIVVKFNMPCVIFILKTELLYMIFFFRYIQLPFSSLRIYTNTQIHQGKSQGKVTYTSLIYASNKTKVVSVIFPHQVYSETNFKWLATCLVISIYIIYIYTYIHKSCAC